MCYFILCFFLDIVCKNRPFSGIQYNRYSTISRKVLIIILDLADICIFVKCIFCYLKFTATLSINLLVYVYSIILRMIAVLTFAQRVPTCVNCCSRYPENMMSLVVVLLSSATGGCVVRVMTSPTFNRRTMLSLADCTRLEFVASGPTNISILFHVKDTCILKMCPLIFLPTRMMTS